MLETVVTAPEDLSDKLQQVTVIVEHPQFIKVVDRY